MPYLGLSRRAALDIEEIYRFSMRRWGKKVAEEYLDGIQEALTRLQKNSDLLRVKPKVSSHFRFYRVNRHFLVCALAGDNIHVLCVKHCSLDLPNRLIELEPHLLREAELLHKTYLAKRRKK
jgi:toxin ParE1/3/4